MPQYNQVKGHHLANDEQQARDPRPVHPALPEAEVLIASIERSLALVPPENEALVTELKLTLDEIRQALG